MQERQVTIGDHAFALPSPFLVLATQNPIEQEGTYRLPEAQLDRFLFKLVLDYPEIEEERLILDRMVRSRTADARAIRGRHPRTSCRGRQQLDQIHLEPQLRDYIVNVVDATRHPRAYGPEDRGPDSLRRVAARFHLSRARRQVARPLLAGRLYVTPQDVKDVALDVLRHRVLVSYEGRRRRRHQRAGDRPGARRGGGAVTAVELARKVRSVELRARRTVGELVSGAYHSAFKGTGHGSSRRCANTSPATNTGAIDWNVTARVGRPYIKRFAEERDQTVMLLLDGSRSQSFGADGALKRDVAAEILAILASPPRITRMRRD